jgi:hypothetical protein
MMSYIVPNWQLRLLNSADILRIALDSPNLDAPAVRLARWGEAIVRDAEHQRAQGELEISAAFRRRGR